VLGIKAKRARVVGQFEMWQENQLDPSRLRGIFGGWTKSIPNAPAIPISWQRPSWISPPGRHHRQLTLSCPQPHSWEGLGGLRAATRGRLRLAQNNEKKSPGKPLLYGGAKMTAEVAILNKAAVALAADSKVTIGSGGNEKTYDSVNKIFTLSKRHPVGIMIYGNADFMGYHGRR
jgi:hypothetical protein